MNRNLFLRSGLALVLVAIFGCSQNGGGGDKNPNHFPPPKNQKPGVGTVVAFGDSLTSGIGQGNPYPEFLRDKLGNVVNTAIAGINSQQALARFDDAVLRLKPKLVILTIGGNDAMQEPRLTKAQSLANLQAMIKKAHEAGALVLFMGIDPPVKKLFPQLDQVPDDRIEAAFEISRFNELNVIARSAGALVVDDCMNGIWLDETLKLDTLHPNEAGSRIMADKVLSAIEGYYP